ncbi:MAG: hypothetical protein C0478_13425 [Planctomyces sp.]|nr:hypothetical protein [Planctomyces sp.]
MDSTSTESFFCPNMSELTTPIDAYKAIIDQLVDEVRGFGHAGHVVEHSLFSKAPAHRRFNEFIQTLPPENRTLLSEMIQEERDGAIHDVLAALTWWLTSQDVGLTFRGEAMPIEFSGMGLHGDYVGRRDGWDWPTDGQDQG